MRPFSNVTSKAPSKAVDKDKRREMRVRKVKGIRARPRRAGKARIVIYGTPGSK